MTKQRKAKIAPPQDVDFKPSTYQPSAKELKEEHDMPGLSDKEIRDTFFRPFRVSKR